MNLDTIANVEKYYQENFNVLTDEYGVLLFMYSVIMTKVYWILFAIEWLTITF